MERKLLLLGLLRQNEMYGYQINEMIDTHLSTSIHLTKPTAYRILQNMAVEGLISSREEKEGNRPTRRVYAITPKGENEFQERINESLSNYIPSENVSAISLAFLDTLPIEDAISHLEKRQSAIENLLHPILDNRTHNGNFQLVTENQILHLSAELEWLKEIIEDLKST